MEMLPNQRDAARGSTNTKELDSHLKELCYVDLNLFEDSRTCSACEKSCGGSFYSCSICEQFSHNLCRLCYQSTDLSDSVHVFEQTDLSARILQLQQTGPVPEARRYFILAMPKACCPTCLDQRPGNPQDYDAMFFEPGGGNRTKSWMSKHMFRMSDLDISATAGCELCSVIYRGVSAVLPSTLKEDDRLQLLVREDLIRVNVLMRGPRWTPWTFIFGADPDARHPWSSLRTLPVIADRFDSDVSFNKIRSWIATCEHEHTHRLCQSTKPQPLPKRVLEVHTASNDPTSVAMTLRVTEDRAGRYIALSHCWGTQVMLTTTTTNIQELRGGIQLKSLPQTFKDTLRIAQALDLQYIWIDSLCIIQDSTSDWETESSKMASIYSNAYFVLVAGSAEDGSHGFLRERPKIYQSLPLKASLASETQDVVVNHMMPHSQATESPTANSTSFMLDSAVHSRGWIMQETSLAGRVLYMYESEMLWECSSAIHCECERFFDEGKMNGTQHYPNILQNAGGGRSFFHHMHGFRSSPRMFTTDGTAENTYAEWRLVVVPLYTNKLLTKTTDRLPALSGLAVRFTELLKDQYVAGMWRGDMSLSLLWYVKDSRHAQDPVPSTYLAPSFCWASVARPVQCPEMRRLNTNGNPMYGEVGIEVINIDTSVRGANPYGHVCDGYLRVKGFTAAFQLTVDQGQASLEGPDICQRLVFYPDTPLVEVHSPPPAEDAHALTSANRATVPIDKQRALSVSVTCLMVKDKPPTTEGYAIRPHVEGDYHEFAMLVLGRAEHRPEAYQRLGVAFIKFEPADARAWLASTEEKELLII